MNFTIISFTIISNGIYSFNSLTPVLVGDNTNKGENKELRMVVKINICHILKL
jgi:hypothetical protein